MVCTPCVAVMHQLIARALGGETGQSDRGWGTGPRSTPLADEDADQFLMSCVRTYEQWQEALAAEGEDSKRGSVRLLPTEERTGKKGALNLFYSHQDQVLQPPIKGRIR
jgi:hypothetical protein